MEQSLGSQPGMAPQRPVDVLLEEMVRQSASDLYVTVGCPPTLRINGRMMQVNDHRMTFDNVKGIIESLLDEEQRAEFYEYSELNMAVHWKDHIRFRANFFQQQQQPGMVVRRIQTEIPTLESLRLPKVYGDLIMSKRGLLLVVGTTGSGKSTSLAAMLGHLNANGSGHVVTIEDPIEYVHEHKNCIFTQREVGIDTESYEIALKNALRQSLDVMFIGEIRDQKTMEHALNFSESGHLCVATLHANNSNQAIQRIINMFPEERHKQVLQNLSHNLVGILSQRLVPNTSGGRSLAMEVMLNEGLITSLVLDGQIQGIKEIMAKSRAHGMQTFDQSLMDLYKSGEITKETAEIEADNPTNLMLELRQYQSSDDYRKNTKVKKSAHLDASIPLLKDQDGG